MTVDTLGRALATYRRTTSSRSALLLIAANAIPVVGVLFFGWSLFTILVLYWLENGIVGLWNLPRILLARGSFTPMLPQLPDAAEVSSARDAAAAANVRAQWTRARAAQLGFAGRVSLAIFFTFHYGIFWSVHGVFVFALPAFVGSDAGAPGSLDPFGSLDASSVAIGAAALFLSHGASFLFNFIWRGEYRTASPSSQMNAPYARVVVLHLTIIFGAMAAAILGAPIAALLLLVGLKTLFDLGLHLRQHRAAAPVQPPLPPATAN